jgi:1,4-alpha-glucan branching enzyme
MTAMTGSPSVALVLNAHLPFVRKPQYAQFYEERWLFEVISETYLPLLRMFRRLELENIPFKVSMVFSPTLLAMLADSLLCERYVAYLDNQIELAQKEKSRLAGDAVFEPLATMYYDLYRRSKDEFENQHGHNIVRAFDYFSKKGHIELMTTAATHAFLPIYADLPEVIDAQIETAIISHRTEFGKNPSGFWLPQLGWYQGLEKHLRAYNIKYTIVTTKGALLGTPLPFYGSFSPVMTPSRVAAFIRDAGATKAVWSETEGYPAHPVYRDFYRDIGYDLDTAYLSPYLTGIERGYTGFKYWAVTGKTDVKRPYEPVAASAQAVSHAHEYLSDRKVQARAASFWMKDRPPLIVCPYDAELFGHWWFEGLQFLEAFFRAAGRKDEENSIRLVTLSEYLAENPDCPESEPEFSSWAEGGYAEAWLDGRNDWVHRHTRKAAERMRELTIRFPNETGLRERILNQAAREVLLSMSSDWALLLRSGKSADFAARQIRESIYNFNHIYEMLSAHTVETEWLTNLEKRHNIFPHMNYRIFSPKK